MLLEILLIFLGFVLLIKGADFLVEGSSNIAKKFHIPEIVIGLTIVSIGTSMPELFISTTSSLNGHSDMSIGNIIGSNVCNLLLILGISAMIRPMKFQRETRLIEIPVCLLITIIFTVFCNTSGIIQKNEALILIVLFVLFIGYTIFMAKNGEKFDKEENTEEVKSEIRQKSIIINLIFVLLGIAGLKIGGDLTVNNALIIARNFNVSEKIIGLTILAIGTSLPELVTSVTAAIKGDSDIAIGNIIGSNMFNTLLIIGISASISPLAYNFTYNIQMGILLGALLLLSLFPIIPPKNQMSRINGTIYVILYVIYMGILFIV